MSQRQEYTILLGLMGYPPSVTLTLVDDKEEIDYIVSELLYPGTWAKILPTKVDQNYENINSKEKEF